MARFALSSVLALSVLASAMPLNAAPAGTNNVLQSREFPLGVTAIVVNPQSTSFTREVTTALQFGAGMWNGQSLAGINLVMVRDVPDDLPNSPLSPANRLTVYVSDSATPAQRDAALDAALAQHPELMAVRPTLRVEPAVIQMEQTVGHQVILHVALMA